MTPLLINLYVLNNNQYIHQIFLFLVYNSFDLYNFDLKIHI
jgi:hypothetical protein